MYKQLLVSQELAIFEKIYDEPVLSSKGTYNCLKIFLNYIISTFTTFHIANMFIDLFKACGFDAPTDANPEIIILVVETQRALIGYTVLMPGYNSRSGRVLCLKNMFVREAYRARGLGRTIFEGVAKYALEHGYGSEENHVLAWNESAVKFYKRMGAEDLSVTQGWAYMRLEFGV